MHKSNVFQYLIHYQFLDGITKTPRTQLHHPTLSTPDWVPRWPWWPSSASSSCTAWPLWWSSWSPQPSSGRSLELYSRRPSTSSPAPTSLSPSGIGTMGMSQWRSTGGDMRGPGGRCSPSSSPTQSSVWRSLGRSGTQVRKTLKNTSTE